MGSRIHLLFLLVLAISWVEGDDRSLVISDLLVTEENYKEPRSESKTSVINLNNEKVCTMCEEFASEAIYYLGENKTQAEIIAALHLACSRLHSFRQQCVLLVDYYAPLLFVEIALVSPESFCEKVNLCEGMVFVPQIYQDSCAICHQAVAEILIKLKDPDTQLDIIETLLKACDKVQNHVKQCKKLVFEYGPLILSNAEQYLEMNDICVSVHACKASAREEVDVVKPVFEESSVDI